MGGAHHRHLHLERAGPLHGLDPGAKLLATVLFVGAVVATPKEQIWAFAAHGVLVTAVALVARVPLVLIVRRLVIELPFVAFAVLLPFVGRAPRTEILGLWLSEPGLWAAWNNLAKGTLGVAASILLAATTPVPAILRGMERLRVPAPLVAITAFMVRYGDVITGEVRRMQIARESRGGSGRWIWQARAVASGAGALFIRSYERGERVHLAMRSRGYTGAMPPADRRPSPGSWAACLALPLVAAVVAWAAWAAR